MVILYINGRHRASMDMTHLEERSNRNHIPSIKTSKKDTKYY